MIQYLDSDFSALNEFLRQTSYTKLFLLVDENTHEHCLPTLLGNLETQLPYEILEIEAGEDMKTLETAAQLWQILLEMEADRHSLLFNIGGGVISDLGGFVASTYKRGIDFINIPTTLLGMCDASIGGKTGVDMGYYKNMVGTFANPQQIFVYPPFLSTLDYTELRSGFAEMLKHGLIADTKHWEDLCKIKELNHKNIAPYIHRSMEIKQTIVDIDYREQRERKALNFGHTAGHAIEGLFLAQNMPIPHGEAVAAGMIIETYIAFAIGLISEDVLNAITVNIDNYFNRIDMSPFSDDMLLSIMRNDKKNSTDKINISLIKSIGEYSLGHDINDEFVKKGFDYYRI